ncbi:MAG: LPS export ABC transporter permease LptG [Desulfobacterales bacterium]|jgi:lipopolysaccharide export system permease protein|nr:LPS export ABC transporter permease LptG [Desulfobacterales bacterium]
MNILHKYLIREIVKYFSMIMVMVVCVYMIVDFFERVDNFMEAGAPLAATFRFLAFKIPFIIAQILPVGVLLSILITLGLMNKKNELVALRSSGIGIYTLFKPIALIGLGSGLLLFFFSEGIVPTTMAKANDIYLREVKKVSAMATRENNIWIKGKQSITHITHYNPVDNAVFGVTLHQFDDQFKLIRRIDAVKGVFKNGEWVLDTVMEQRINTKPHALEVNFHSQKTEPVDLVPEDLSQVAKKSEEMSFDELRNYIRDIEAEGYDAGNYRVDLHAKTALPFACLIMSMVGSGIAVRRAFKERLSLIIAWGIAIIFLYWVVFSFCISLGYGGILLPVISAWLTNLVFLCLGGIALLNAD